MLFLFELWDVRSVGGHPARSLIEVPELSCCRNEINTHAEPSEDGFIELSLRASPSDRVCDLVSMFHDKF